jgi:hypothetical protein
VTTSSEVLSKQNISGAEYMFLTRPGPYLRMARYRNIVLVLALHMEASSHARLMGPEPDSLNLLDRCYKTIFTIFPLEIWLLEMGLTIFASVASENHEIPPKLCCGASEPLSIIFGLVDQTSWLSNEVIRK